ncbi:1-phosphofructokinase family hexose kinase [Yoonia sp.]|uniref:1-phosphofructokinase family hexose kinase n=1 Tax=Yoonia sp. TaxID=2212373 RepID=UPI003A4D642F
MTQSPILTVTLNPALDLSAQTPSVVPGPKLRCSDLVQEPGGGGINVSRAILELGGKSRALVGLGGAVGKMLAGQLADVGIETVVLPISGETRQSLSVIETGTGAQFRFVMPGPVWSTDDEARALALVHEQLVPGTQVVLSGSQPPGVDVSFPARLGAICTKAGAVLMADTSGSALAGLAQNGGVDILRMNRDESEALAGHTLPTLADSVAFARDLFGPGRADIVLIARGDEGTVLVTPDQALHCRTPVVQVVSAVGAGDSFVAAFVLALARGQDLGSALAFGTAAAAAAVMTPGTALCRANDVARLVSACYLESC